MPSREYADEEIRALAYQRWGVHLKPGGKYLFGPCPFCRGGHDRFNIWKQGGNFWCRNCREKGWLEDNRKDWKPDPELYTELQNLLKQEESKQLATLAWLRSKWIQGALVEKWNAGMQEEQREYWRGEGIPEWAVNYYKLGYCPDKVFRGDDDNEFHSPAYTIPVYEPSTWQLVNIQYRLLEAGPGMGGKYRQEAGIPASAFYTRRGLLEGKAIIVEGAKKAIVVLECIEKACQVIGWPSMTPGGKLIRDMATFAGGLWIILDPGSNNEGATERAAKILHPVPVRWVEMPTKPDDAIVKYGMDKEGLRGYLKQARRL